MAVYAGPEINNSGLVLALDAANAKSYPGSGATWTDLIGNYNGTLTGSPTFSTLYGGSIDLNGTSQYGTATMPNPFAETIIVWADSATATWNQYGWISSSRAENGHIFHPTISTKSVEFFIASSAAGLTSLGSITVGDITIPHMYCYTTNGSNSHKVYLDAQLQITSTTAITRTASPTNQTYYYGKDATLARYGNGSLYKIERYNRQLTDSEILQNFIALRGRFGI